ncbi:MAG: M20 family metallopeptidase [Candidatus Kariarchaeaceae archaeon]|jgi:succinyl-diaminopimelate desuccinylase
MRQEVETLVQNLVRIDSTDGDIEAATVLQAFLSSYGFDAQLDEYKPSHANVVASIGPKSAPSIIISGHLDVVPVGDQKKWTHDPFSGKIIDGELWGRGSVDMKGGTGSLAGVMVELLKHEDELNHQIIFAATAEEETGLHGARHLETQGIMDHATHLLIAEPSDLGVAIMEKGILWAEISAKGKQAHGSRPDLGLNAIEGLTGLIPDFHSIVPDIELPEVGKSTLNIGQIFGGTAANVVPENATIMLDYRLTPGVDVKDMIAHLEKILFETYEGDIKYSLKTDNEANAVISTDRSFGESLAKNTEKYTGKRPELGGVQYATDAASFMINKQVNFAVFGPGSVELLHQTNERLDLNQLDIARKVTLETLLEIAT